MIYSKEQFRPIPEYPVYPPYHTKEYLEDYFYSKFTKELPLVNRDYIGISWTTLYCDNKRNGLQQFLNEIPPKGKYFTVSQHDDAPSEILPENTLCFSAGGNVQGKNIIPIPLVCSSLPVQISENRERKILASFVGSATHPIRIKMAESCKSNKNIAIYMKGWTPSVSQNEFETFINLTANSKFCLCPRGYGLNSFRLYEAMQLGSVPVVITNNFYLPWKDELDWSKFSVLVSEKQIPDIGDILAQYSEEQILFMQKEGKKLWKEYFSMDGLYKNILKRIK